MKHQTDQTGQTGKTDQTGQTVSCQICGEAFGTMDELKVHQRHRSLSDDEEEKNPHRNVRIDSPYYIIPGPETPGLSTVLETFGDLSLIEEICYNEEFETLPDQLGDVENLRKLYLTRGIVTSLPESFGNLQKLEELSLSAHRFSRLPEPVTRLTNLRTLNLPSNQIEELPESFGDLASLEDLDLALNRIRTLPEAFGRLTNLKRLDLNSNHLRSLPASFGDLVSLEELYLQMNSGLLNPKSDPSNSKILLELPNLKELWISNTGAIWFPEPIAIRLREHGCKVFFETFQSTDPYDDSRDFVKHSYFDLPSNLRVHKEIDLD
jgi:Leucine-rich repeat (LRR) protein